MSITMKILIAVFILAFSPCLAFAQTTESIVHDIRHKYNQIQTQLPKYQTKQIPIFNESTEGGEARAFFDDQQDIKCIEIIWLGESGKKIMTYYFDKTQLFFAYEQRIIYNRPIYWNIELAKEIGDTEIFDPQKSTITIQRYYFENEKLVLWLDHANKSVNLDKLETKQQSQDILHHAAKMYRKFKLNINKVNHFSIKKPAL